MSASMTGVKTDENFFTTTINRLRADPKIPLLIAAAAAVAIVVALLLWAKGPDYRVLYSNLSDHDGGAIVTQLTQLNIPYRFADQGGALLIPADKVYETRLRLAQQGLPKGGSVGFELLDQEKFGISRFNEQINYQRALEGELSRTIKTLGVVQNARVHLALPKPSLFVRKQKSASASVTLHLQPGRTVDDGQINAIVYMVSSSVAGLPAGNVTVIDQNGRLLTHATGSGRDLNSAQLKYIKAMESHYQRRIESILAAVVGIDNVRAQVTAQIDFAAREQTDEEYKPNQLPQQGAVRSQQVSHSEQIAGSHAGNVPGALSNQPSAPATAPIDTPEGKERGSQNGKAKPESTRRDKTTNYEVDRTIRYTQQQAGIVQRLSVAVVVNHLNTGKNGEPAALTKEQLTQIESLARGAMGYSSERGDSLSVVNTPFIQTENLGTELPFWQQQTFFDVLLSAGRYLLVLAVAWILWRKVVHPALMKKQAMTRMTESNDTPSTAPLAEAAKRNEDALAQRAKSQQQASTEVQIQRIRELAQRDPNVVARVIRQWMSNDA